MPKTTAKLEDFDILSTIGSGTYGQCKKICRKSDKKVYVWKEVDYHGMTEKEKQLLVQEVNLLRELRHPHIVRYHDRIIDRTHSTLYIIMEYCEGGSLADLISRKRKEGAYLKESFVWRVFHQLLLALQDCHRKREGMHKIIHRDLKPANIFLDKDLNVKLGDFGLARVFHHNFSLAKTFVGSPYYMSPEQFTEELYDERSDLWSLGCLMYELCALSPPFTAPNQRVLAARVREGRFKRIPHTFSSEMHSITADLLQTNPSRRPDIATLLERVSLHITQPPTALPEPTAEYSSVDSCVTWERQLAQREEAIRKQEKALAEWERRLIAREKALADKEELLLHVGSRLKKRAPLEAVDTNKYLNT